MKMKLKSAVLVVVFALFFSYANAKEKEKTNLGEVPTVALMSWFSDAKEGSAFGELRLYQTGVEVDGLKVKYKITGTAKIGFDYTNIFNFVVMKKNPTKELFDYGFDYTLIDPNIYTHVNTSIMIDPIPDGIVEGDETVTITLLEDPAYKIDPKFATQTVTIQDAETPDVQFEVPAAFDNESVTSPKIKLTFSEAPKTQVKIDYSVKTILAEEGNDFEISSKSITVPAGKTEAFIPLKVVNDNIAEDDETVQFRLINVEGANIGDNQRFNYTIVNDDGEVKRSIIHDKIYGALFGSRAGSSLGAICEMVVDINQIEKVYGHLDYFIPYVHNRDIKWAHPAGGTEDGIERHKLLCSAIADKMDNITAEDVRKTWIEQCDLRDMYYLTQPYDRVIARFAKWGLGVDEIPVSRFGKSYELGEHIHLTARSFQPIPCINACDPEGAIKTMKDVGQLYYEHANDEAFHWGAVYEAALCLAMRPDATVESVINGAMEYATPDVKEELGYALSIVDKYADKEDKKPMLIELNEMYSDPNSKYFADKRIPRYVQSSIFENVSFAFAIFKVTKGNLKDAAILATIRGRDTDCSAASAAALAGALTGTTTTPKEWIDQIEEGNINTPYTNNHMTVKATADVIYRALQNKLRRMKKEVEAAGDNLSDEMKHQKAYVEMMERLDVI